MNRLIVLLVIWLVNQQLLFSEANSPISDYSLLFRESDVVAIVEFSSVNIFTIKEIILPVAEANTSSKFSAGDHGIFTTEQYVGSEDPNQNIIILQRVPYLVFLKIQDLKSKKEGQYVFQAVHGRHGFLPLIDLEKRLKFEGVRDWYAQLWFSYSNGNADYIYTPDYLFDKYVSTVMLADYSTLDGTLIKEAILGIRDLLRAGDAASRMKILSNEELWANPVFRVYFRSILSDVKIKDSF